MLFGRRDCIIAKIVFPVHDLDVASEFYESIGLTVDRYDDGYAWVKHRGDEVLHLALVADMDPATNHAAGYWHVRDVEQWHARCERLGPARGELAAQPWGLREFALHDPCGNLLRLGQHI